MHKAHIWPNFGKCSTPTLGLDFIWAQLPFCHPAEVARFRKELSMGAAGCWARLEIWLIKVLVFPWNKITPIHNCISLFYTAVSPLKSREFQQYEIGEMQWWIYRCLTWIHSTIFLLKITKFTCTQKQLSPSPWYKVPSKEPDFWNGDSNGNRPSWHFNTGNKSRNNRTGLFSDEILADAMK